MNLTIGRIVTHEKFGSYLIIDMTAYGFICNTNLLLFNFKPRIQYYAFKDFNQGEFLNVGWKIN